MAETKGPKYGFAVRKTYTSDIVWDKYYIDREIVQVVKKTGEGETDFVIENKVIETKRDIAQVIAADACNAGIDSYLALYEQSGLPLPPVTVSDEIADFSEAGENLAEAIDIGKTVQKAFNNLDPELKAGRSIEGFINSITDEEVKKYCLAKAGIKDVVPDTAEKKGDDK